MSASVPHRKGPLTIRSPYECGRYVLLQESQKVGLQIPLVIALNLKLYPPFRGVAGLGVPKTNEHRSPIVGSPEIEKQPDEILFEIGLL